MTEPEHPIRIGCSGWSYPDWEDVFYPPGLKASEYLEHYADHFPTVEVDSSFYRVPTPAMVRGWRNRTPADFLFTLKVPRAITHEKQLRDCRAEVEEFVGAVHPLRPKLAAALLQMGYFNRSAFASQAEFLGVLDAFLADWPHQIVPLAVEIRNPRWLTAEFFEVLRSHGAAFAPTEQTWMPRPAELARDFDLVTGPLAFVRLVGDRESIEKITSVWNAIVVDRSADLAETAVVIRDLARRVPVFVFVNNHYAGYSPGTIRMLRELLKLPEPVPPERPRRTLFD